MKYAIFLMLGLSLAGCASAELSDDQLKGIHRVAVFSAVGDTLDMREIPLFGIGGSDDIVQIPDFGLDRYITDKITAKLTGQYQVVAIKTPIPVKKGAPDDDWWFGHNTTKVDLPAGGDVGNGKVDTFVLIEPGMGFPFGADQVHGPFVAHHPSMAPVETVVGIAYDIVIVDARTGKELKRVGVPVAKDADNSIWQEKFSALTPSQKLAINTLLHQVVDVTVDKVLEIMKLAGAGEPT